MANTGHKWGAWAFAQIPVEGDWDAEALANNATLTSDTPIDLDIKTACEVGIVLTAGAGALSGLVTVYVLGSGGGIGDEETTIGSPWAFTITPEESDTVYKRFSVDPGSYGEFKIAVKNESDESLDVSVKYRTADFPVAS